MFTVRQGHSTLYLTRRPGQEAFCINQSKPTPDTNLPYFTYSDLEKSLNLCEMSAYIYVVRLECPY